MPIHLPSIRDPRPENAIRGALQPDDSIIWYMPGDALPAELPPALGAIKAQRIAEINDECRARILAVWPLEKQVSATLGIYGPAELAAMTDWIDAHIAASNTATSAVFDATTQAAMEAVTVAWPV